jgi:cytochrome c-type biogenesis protein CcmE
LAEKNRRRRRVWKAVKIILISIAVVLGLLVVLNFSVYKNYFAGTEQVEPINEPVKMEEIVQ